jgi:CRP/FNR family transcriptional regulator, cyclic AMP receptor protein
LESNLADVNGCRRKQSQQASGFYSRLSPAALKDLNSMEFPHCYAANVVLFSEKQEAEGLFVVLDGEVRLSINSTDGKRLSLQIAKKGEILGLSSTLSGRPYEFTAETLYPAKIAPITRRDFLNFLGRHPEAYHAVTEELSRHVSMVCEQLRTVALSSSAPEKLARLLLEWSESDHPATDCGSRVRFSMTHEEIGEFIGASRETVTRTLSTFKTRRLVAFQGSMLTIPSRTALASYAGA